MAVDKIINSSCFSKIANSASNAVSSMGGKISNLLENSPKADTFRRTLDKIEPTRHVNAFIPMATLMGLFVIVPRVKTAEKRNPDDKEATKDEIKEILFRDVQTVLVVLFVLDAINAIAAGKASKISGLPMTNKPYEKVFNTQEKGLEGAGLKVTEFFSNPLEVLKKTGKNLIDTLNPIGGVFAKKNDEIVSDYSGFNSMEEISKMFKRITANGGDEKKIYNKVMDILISEQEEFIYGNSKIGNKKVAGLVEKARSTAQENGEFTSQARKEIENARKLLDELKEMKNKGIDALNEENISENANLKFVDFFMDKNNRLVLDAKGLNAKLRTGALIFEAGYLGFGLPALNQRRLEKKYLNTDGANISKYVATDGFNPLKDKNLKAQEVKIFHDFIK